MQGVGGLAAGVLLELYLQVLAVQGFQVFEEADESALGWRQVEEVGAQDAGVTDVVAGREGPLLVAQESIEEELRR